MGMTTTLKFRLTSITKQAAKPAIVRTCRRGQHGARSAPLRLMLLPPCGGSSAALDMAPTQEFGHSRPALSFFARTGWRVRSAHGSIRGDLLT
jgi:hypothetical protein